MIATNAAVRTFAICSSTELKIPVGFFDTAAFFQIFVSPKELKNVSQGKQRFSS